MRGRTVGFVTMTVIAAAAIFLLVVVPATAGDGKHKHKVKVRGECCVGGSPKITGGLDGTWAWDDGGFEAFLSSMKYNQATGVMTFVVPEVFHGTVGGRTGVLHAVGRGKQRVKPGTPLYDFSRWPEEQSGTTGDPELWLGGSGRSTIISGKAGLLGATGVIRFKSLEPLGRSSYKGTVTLPS